jgi:DDB1- and CUL4-associated factor 7
VHIIALDDEKGEFAVSSTFDHPYPTTKILWAPEAAAREKDLLATTGDYLRLWRVTPDDTKLECLLNNVRGRGGGVWRGEGVAH